MPMPYVGITGFMRPDEVDAALAAFGTNTERLLMVGVLASQKTLRGMANNHPGRYPLLDNIPSIFPADARALNLIHFNTKDPDTLSGQLSEATVSAGSSCNGFQLNIAWPDVVEIERFRDNHPSSTIVLQIGRQAFEDIGNNPRLLPERVREYADLVQYVLLDPSGGVGQPLNPDSLLRYLDALHEYGVHENFGLGVAGGLSATTMHILTPIVERYPNVSIDAEGRLRDKPADTLSIPAATAYITESLKLFARW